MPSKQRTKVRPARATPPTWVTMSISGVEQREAVVDMFGSESEEGLAGVYKPLGERRRSLPFLTLQEPVNLVKPEVDLGSDLDRLGYPFARIQAHGRKYLSQFPLSPTGASCRMFLSWLGY